MTIQGDVHPWLPGLTRLDSIMLEVLLPAAWPDCCSTLGGVNVDETQVTEQLICNLKKRKYLAKEKYPEVLFRIYPEVPVKLKGQRGRIDIFLIPLGEKDSDDEDYYLAYECKWLGKPKNVGVSAYIGKDGMERFICGKYSRKNPIGNMLGYTFLNDPSGLVAVEKQLRDALIKQGYLIEDFRKQPSSVIRAIGQTSHSRQGMCHITIGHILLPYNAQ